MTYLRLPATVPELLDWADRQHHDLIAYQQSGPTTAAPMTFGALAEAVRQRTRQLPAGDGIVTIYLDSSIEWSINLLAAMAQARPAVLVDARLELSAIVSQLRDAQPQVVITDDVRGDLLRAAWRLHASDVKPPLILDTAVPETWPGGGFARQAMPGDVAAILYTSGSTGTPKGVQQTHRGIVASALRVAEIGPLSAADTILSLVPFSHILGFCGVLLSPLFAGARVLFLESFKPARITEALRAHPVTTLYAPPVLYEVMVSRISEKLHSLPRSRARVVRLMLAFSKSLRRLSPRLAAWLAGKVFASARRELGARLEKLITGGARLRSDVADMLLTLGFDLRQAYGLSEAAGVCVCRPFQGRAASVGVPMKGMSIKINAPNENGEGEILVRGDQLMLGYYRRPDLTAAVMHDGWFRTGDVGRLDPRGELLINGRLNEIIVTSNGKKIYPEDLEAHFAGIQGLAELCVFGLPTAEGTIIALAATPSTAAPFGAGALEDLRRRLEEKNAFMPPHRRVQRFFVRTDELPKTTTRKLQRHRLIAELTAVPSERRKGLEEAAHEHRS